jgi:transposase-like protein
MTIQLTPKEERKQRKFTPQQKLEILKEWEVAGNGVEVAEKHQIHPITLYRWKKRLEQGAEEFLKGSKRKVDVRIRELERENQKLKEALALQAQELMALKKKMHLV